MSARNITQSEGFVAALGKEPDADVAKRFGVSLSTVFQARTGRNIPSHAELRRQEVIPLLKTTHDDELVAKYGYSKAGVAALRRKHNAPYEGEAKPRTRRKRNKDATQEVTEKALAQANPLVERFVAPKNVSELTNDPAMMEFLTRRHKVGDSTEALAARIEVPEEVVRQALGL